jgi:hypothetical protein
MPVEAIGLPAYGTQELQGPALYAWRICQHHQTVASRLYCIDVYFNKKDLQRNKDLWTRLGETMYIVHVSQHHEKAASQYQHGTLPLEGGSCLHAQC